MFNAGGLTAVMWTDTIQAFILIGGSSVLTIMGNITTTRVTNLGVIWLDSHNFLL